jgi:hypothetical protein
LSFSVFIICEIITFENSKLVFFLPAQGMKF